MRGDTGQVSPAGGVLDHDQRVDATEQHGVHVDEVGGEEAAGLRGQELPPGRAGTAWRGIDPGIVQDLPHRGGCDRVAEPDQLALHPPMAPCGVLRRDADHELADRGCRRRPPGDPDGLWNPTCARPADGAGRAESRVSPRKPRPTGGGEPIATVLRATADRLAGNGPGWPGGAGRCSHVAAPGALRPWTPAAGPAPLGNPAGSVQAGRRPK